jgi:hypothetical protein
MERTISPVSCHGKPRRSERRRRQPKTAEDSGAALRRIKADLPAREAVRKRLKFGMTIVTTDQPADAKTRSGDGFVVLDSQS